MGGEYSGGRLMRSLQKIHGTKAGHMEGVIGLNETAPWVASATVTVCGQDLVVAAFPGAINPARQGCGRVRACVSWSGVAPRSSRRRRPGQGRGLVWSRPWTRRCSGGAWAGHGQRLEGRSGRRLGIRQGRGLEKAHRPLVKAMMELMWMAARHGVDVGA